MYLSLTPSAGVLALPLKVGCSHSSWLRAGLRAAHFAPIQLSSCSPDKHFSLPVRPFTSRSDCSLPSRDSDALVLRAAVLLDEMVEDERPDGGGPTVAAQVRAGP